jgi:alanine dehydrogenase
MQAMSTPGQPMRVFSAEEVCELAPMSQLIECVKQAFARRPSAPARHVATVPGGKGDRLLLYMPAFDSEGGGMVKLATVFPDNQSVSRPTIQAALIVFSSTGTPVAVLDGAAVTRLRTGAASALASTYLSRADSTRMLIVGTGVLAPFMALAHCTVRPISEVVVWGRRIERAAATATDIRALVDQRLNVHTTSSLEGAIQTADIICCATSSSEPLLQGQWLRCGAFVDLVGSFSPERREADDETLRRSRIFVDTFDGSLAEAGDLLSPLQRGVISLERIEGELADLVSGRVVGRRHDEEIILFKSVGSAIEDLAAARMIVTAAKVV